MMSGANTRTFGETLEARKSPVEDTANRIQDSSGIMQPKKVAPRAKLAAKKFSLWGSNAMLTEAQEVNHSIEEWRSIQTIASQGRASKDGRKRV